MNPPKDPAVDQSGARQRVILHLDMDAFFAAIELLRHPELKGKPVVVGGAGDPTQRGVVSTATYEARRYGIHSGMPLRTAYRLCPDAVFLPVDFDTYVRFSRRIKKILREFSPRVEDAGLDEAFIELTDSTQPPETIAQAIKERVRAVTRLSCSIGIAPNKLLAKLASDMQKPDGLTVLRMDDIPPRIWPLPVRKLIGVGPKTEARLAELGVHTIGELAAKPVETLVELIGESHGRYLHEAAHGRDESPVVTHWQRRSVSSETTFPADVGNRARIDAALTELAQDVAARLQKHHYTARTITLKLRFADFETHTRALTLNDATDSAEAIAAAAHECLERIPLAKRVRLLGVRATNLSTPALAPAERNGTNQQQQLFEP